MTPFPERAGAASSLLGFVQQTVAALCGAIVGHLLGAERLAARHRRRADGLRQPAAVAVDARVARACLTPAEQIIEQPAVEPAAGGFGRIGRARPDRRRRTQRGVGRVAALAGAALLPMRPDSSVPERVPGSAGDRHALVRGAHEPAPDLDRQPAAGDVLGRRAVVVAEPDAGDQMCRCSR